MAYTALEKMRICNRERFQKDLGPFQPALHAAIGAQDLKSAALRFLHQRCEGLLFDMEKEENDPNTFSGTSILPDQIPYNMQMDLNRLCLERELERFIDSGVAEDAYNVYYCYLEMFFGHYGKSKKMVELLSEFESNGSSLLMKHRDHYSHSVYVFALGLALYESNEHYRKKFKEFYQFDTDEKNKAEAAKAANTYLEFWGLTSLFHDIGYPFELPFEQVMAYFEVDNQERGKESVTIAYRSVDVLTQIGEEGKKHFEELYGRSFSSINEILAADITAKLGGIYGFTEEYLLDVLTRKPTNPETFGYFMDHAWFSSARLFCELVESLGIEGISKTHIDALSAIMLHNSLFKFSICFYKDDAKRKEPLRMELHPLAYMLMICDELQCWDRTAYGRNSRTELHPMGAHFDLSNNAIRAEYDYDREEQEKIDTFQTEYQAWENAGRKDKAPRLKAYSDMAEKEQRFVADIEMIVNTEEMPLTVVPTTRKLDRRLKHTYLSSSNFLHLYDFAVALNGRYSYQGEEKSVDTEILEEEFEKLSLEYQLSNINQAKNFSRYLNAIHCFFTDKPVDYEMVTEFLPEHIAVFAPMEHERWITEHASMGWTYGDDYETLAEEHGLSAKDLREQFRQHKLAMEGDPTKEEIHKHYESLSDEDKGKDWRPFNSMLKLIKKFDGLRIYKLDQNE
ncbi:MAG: hypothetical protein IKZ95_09300 [Lachnospiraceae bacterium]|nr:hypothetical protein [Lachnospiraceae bacterium]